MLEKGPILFTNRRQSFLPSLYYVARQDTYFFVEELAVVLFQEAVPQERPVSVLKHEQQKKWLEELDKQQEEAKLRKIEEKLNLSKVFVI